jgi:hypothetical protein
MDTGEYQTNLDAFNTAKDQLSGLVDQVRGLQGQKQDAVNTLGTVLQTGGNLGSGVMGVLGTIEQITKGTQLEETISSLKNQISTLKDNLADGIQKGVDSGITKATEAAKSLTGGNQQLNSMIDNAATATRTTTNTAINQASGGDLSGLMDTAKSAGASLRTTGSDTVNLVRSTATDAANTAETTVRGVATNVEQGLTNAISTGSETMTGLANQTISLASNAGAKASGTVSGMVSDARQLATTIPRTAKAVVNQTQQSPSTAAPTQTTDAPAVAPEAPSLDLPSFEGLADFPASAEPIANLFGLVPKAAISTVSQTVSQTAPQIETAISGLGTTARAVQSGASQLPSQVLGIANKGMRGDSTLARALGLPGEKTTPTQLTTPVQKTEVMPTMEDYQNVSGFSDPSETILTKYLPKGDFGDLEASFAATGIPREVLAQVREQEGSVLISGKSLQPSTLNDTAPQSRITAPEPDAQPIQLQPQAATGTPNNPSASAAAQAQAQAKTQVSEIEPAIGPELPPPGTAPSTAVAPSTAAAPKPASIQPTTAAEGGEIAEGGTGAVAGGEIEAGASAGPEGLVAGAILAGLTSLIGGLINDFHKSAPSIPIFQTTGAALSPQEQVNAATAF